MKHRILTFAAVALCFTACSNDDNIAQDFLADTPISLNVSVDEPRTRAGYSNEDKPEKFWLDVQQGGGGSKYDYQVTVKKEGDSWKTYNAKEGISVKVGDEITMLWANMNNDATIYAGSKETKDGYISTTEDQSSEDKLKEADFLLMPLTSVTPSTAGIKVDFKHAMSKINLTIELESEYEFTKEDVKLKITDVKIDGSAEKACMVASSMFCDFTNHVYTNPQTITPLHTGATAFSKDTDGKITKASATYEAILIPQPFESGKFTVSFMVDGKTYAWTYDKKLTLAPSTAYTLKLTAGNDKVQPASFSAASWGTGNGDEGEKKETD